MPINENLDFTLAFEQGFDAWLPQQPQSLQDSMNRHLQYTPEELREDEKKRLLSVGLVAQRTRRPPEEVDRQFESFYMPAFSKDDKGLGASVTPKDANDFYEKAKGKLLDEKDERDTFGEGLMSAFRGDDVIPALQAWQSKNGIERLPKSTAFTRGFLKARESIAGIGVSDAVDAYQRAMQGSPKDGDEETLKDFEALLLDLPGAKRKAVLTAAAMMAQAKGENAAKGVGARESGPMGGAGSAINAITGFFQEIGESGGRFAGKLGGIAKDEELDVMANLPALPLLTDAAKARHPLATGVAYTSTEKIDSADKAADFIKEWKVTSFGTASADVTRADIEEAGQTAKQYRELDADEKKLIEAAQKRELKKNQIARELRSIAESSDPVGEISGAIGSSVAMAAANIITRGKTLPISWQLYSEANYDQLRLENPSLEPSEARAISRVSGAGEAALDALEIGILRKLPSVAAVLKSGTSAAWRNAGARLGATFAFEQAQEGVQDLTLPFTRAVFEAVGRDTGLDMAAEWERWKDSRGTVAIASIPLILLGAGIATHRDIKDAQNWLSSRDRLGEQGIIEVEAVPIIEAAQAGKMEEAQALYRNAFKRRSSEVAAEYQAKLETQQKVVAEAVVEVTRQGLIPEYTLLPGGKVVVTDLNDGSKATFDSWRDAQPVIEQNMNEMERINNDSILRIADDILQRGEEVTVSPRSSESLADRVRGGSMSPEDAIKAAIAGNVIKGVSIDEARLIAADVFGESQEERIKIMRDAVERAIVLGSNVVQGGVSKSKLFKGADLTTLIEETSEGRLKEGLRVGRYKKGDWLGLIQQAEEATGEKFLIGSTVDAVNASPDFAPRELVEAVSRIVVADVLGRLQDGRRIGSGSITKSLEENNSPLVAWIRAFKRLLASVLQTAKRIHEARKAGKLGDEYDAYIDDLLGVDQQSKFENEAAAEADAIANEALNVGGVSYSEENGKPVGETFSLRASDAAYLAAVEAGDTATAQAMVDAAAKAAGYNVGPVWHYGAKGITEFRPFAREIMSGDRTSEQVDAFIRRAKEGQKIGTMDFRAGTFFTPQRGSYSGYGPQEYGVYLKVENAAKRVNKEPWTLDVPGKAFDAIMMDMDGDGVVKEIAIIDPSKIKSADPVTRDESGNVIPLSQRFNPADDRITFSLRATPADASRQTIMPDGARLVGPTTFSVRAFHGTPHKVDKFSTSRIGTGEGAQAYGWGLYFAESFDVADDYRGKLQNEFRIGFNGKTLVELYPENEEAVKLQGRLESIAKGTQYGSQGEQVRKAFIGATYGDMLSKAPPSASVMFARQVEKDYGTLIKTETGGNLYTVELLPDEADFLDWDKPLSEQSAEVKAALADFSPDTEVSGGDWYQSNQSITDPNPKETSEWLASLGIPGICYLDGGSRGAGDGTRNYVIFDESLVKILEENGKPVGETFSLRATPADALNGETFSMSVAAAMKHPRVGARGMESLQSYMRKHLEDNFKFDDGGKSSDFVLRIVPTASLIPSQTGEDYDNDSSRETAARIRDGFVITEDGRWQDLLPVHADEMGNLYDGNHRHFAATLNGDAYMLAMVPKDSSLAISGGAEETLSLRKFDFSAKLAPAAEILRNMRQGGKAFDFASAYRAASAGQSTSMLPLTALYDEAKKQVPALTEAEFGKQVQALYDSGNLLLEPGERADSMRETLAKFGVRDSLGIPAMFARPMETGETFSVQPSPGGLSEAEAVPYSWKIEYDNLQGKRTVATFATKEAMEAAVESSRAKHPNHQLNLKKTPLYVADREPSRLLARMIEDGDDPNAYSGKTLYYLEASHEGDQDASRLFAWKPEQLKSEVHTLDFDEVRDVSIRQFKFTPEFVAEAKQTQDDGYAWFDEDSEPWSDPLYQWDEVQDFNVKGAAKAELTALDKKWDKWLASPDFSGPHKIDGGDFSQVELRRKGGSRQSLSQYYTATLHVRPGHEASAESAANSEGLSFEAADEDEPATVTVQIRISDHQPGFTAKTTPDIDLRVNLSRRELGGRQGLGGDHPTSQHDSWEEAHDELIPQILSFLGDDGDATNPISTPQFARASEASGDWRPVIAAIDALKQQTPTVASEGSVPVGTPALQPGADQNLRDNQPSAPEVNPESSRAAGGTFSLRSGDFASRVSAAFSPFQRNPELRMAIAQVAKQRAQKLGAEWIEKAAVIRSTGDIGKESRMREALAYEARMNEYLDGLTPNARQTLEFEPSSLNDDPLISAMLDHGKLMSQSTARKLGKVEAKAGDYDGAPWLPPAWYSKGAGIMPDQMAQAMHDAGLLPDAYTDTLWKAVASRIASTKKNKAAHREAVTAYKAAQKYARDASRAEADKWAEGAKKKAESPKAQRESLAAATRTIEGILAAAPPEVRARAGGYIGSRMAKLATDEARLKLIEETISKLNVELEKYLKKEGVAEIQKLLKRGRPDAKAGKRGAGKDADMHALFAAAERAIPMTAEAVAEELARLDTLIGGDTLTPEQEALAITERGIVELAGDLKSADSGRVFSALDTLREIYEGGWLKWKLRQIEKREDRAGQRADFIADTGKSGVKPERDAADKAAVTLLGKIKGGFLSLSSFQEVLSYAFGSKSDRVKALVDAEREASGQYEDVTQALADEVETLFADLAGGSVLAGERLRYDMAQRTIKTGKGDLSQLEAIQALLMWRQEDGRRHMEGAMDENGKPIGTWNYDQAWIDEITAALTPEARSVMAWLSQKYAAEHPALNALYRERYGVNMPAHDNYAPITVQPVQTKSGEVNDPVSGAAISSGSILVPGSLRARSRSAIAEPDFRDSLQTFMAHTRQLEYWKAYYDLAFEAGAILGNREVLNAVKAKGGEPAATALAKWIDAIAQGGFRDASASLGLHKLLSRMTGRAASVGLLGRFSTLLVQSTQLGAASVKMPVGAYLVRLSKLLTGNLSFRDAINSPFIQRRYKSAPPIVRQALEGLGVASRPNQITRATRHLGDLLSGADAMFTAGTYAMLLDYHRGTGRALGLTGAELETHAHTEAERDTEAVAQPTRMATRSLAELTSTNPLAKVSWAYASEARQKIALMAWATMNAKAEPAKFAKTAFLVFGVGGLMTQILKNLWREAKGDDDENKWSPERLTVTALAGPLHGIPLASQLQGDGGMLSGVTWAWPALKDIAAGEGDMRDVDTLLSVLGLFNDTAAGIASLSHAGLDAAKVLENLASEK